jgi:hypothetical protein
VGWINLNVGAIILFEGAVNLNMDVINLNEEGIIFFAVIGFLHTI